jgi:hypothetical protein
VADAPDVDFDFDAFFREYEESKAARKVRKEHPYLLDLIKTLLPRGLRGDQRPYVIDRLRKDRQRLGLSMPDRFDEAVQSTYNRYCVDSSVFRNRGAPPLEGIFHSPHGKGKGIWAVYPDRAIAWLKAKAGDEPAEAQNQDG